VQLGTFDGQLNEIVQRWNLLRHPFYEAWVAGTLSTGELRDYAIQYAHVTAAIPTWLLATAAAHPQDRDALGEHAREETEHVALWHAFAKALGVGVAQIEHTPPNAATAKLLRDCQADALAGNGAATVWALEVQSPAVSAEKLRGLALHYGMQADTGAEYFALHAELDKQHERQLREFMRAHDPSHAAAAAHVAENTTKRLWDLLTSVHAGA